MIKKMLGVSICCHHKALLFAIHVKGFKKILKINKLNLIKRLLNNTYTKKIIIERIKQEQSNALVNINDIWRDAWLWLEEWFDSRYDEDDIIEVIKSINS
jgi:hypothetical protein